jgi:hypothetical protein
VGTVKPGDSEEKDLGTSALSPPHDYLVIEDQALEMLTKVRNCAHDKGSRISIKHNSDVG